MGEGSSLIARGESGTALAWLLADPRHSGAEALEGVIALE
jgi:hypothetical protein